MKRLLVFVLFTIGCEPPPPVEAMKVSPEEFLQKWTKALLQSEVDRVVTFYENSNDVVMVQSSGQVRKGISEIRKAYESAFNEGVFQKVFS